MKYLKKIPCSSEVLVQLVNDTIYTISVPKYPTMWSKTSNFYRDTTHLFFKKKKPLTLALVSRCCDSDYFQSDSSNLLLNMLKSINLLGTNLMKPKVKLYTPSTPKKL